MDDEDQIIFLGIKDDDMDQHVEELADSDLYSMLDDEVVSIFGFGIDDSNKEGIEYTMIVDALEERMPELISDSLKNILPQIIKDSFQHVLPKDDQRVHETLQTTMHGLISKPLNKVLNAINILETQRFENLQKELITAISKKVGKSVKKCVWKDMDIGEQQLINNKMASDKEEQPSVQETTSAPPITEQAPLKLTVLVVHASVEKDSEEKVSKEEPPSKRLKFLIPNPITSSPNPLNTILPQNNSLDQFTDNLFKTTSSEYSLYDRYSLMKH
ncbi:hypothetical protein Tco_1564117 [Tanacetum coccineum]